ncbi:MAG: response regulator [Candidatus Binatia bacterium]
MSSEKILVVDDHKDGLELLQLQLQSLGWEAIPARSGREALEKIKSVRPSLIVLNMLMPEMNGFEVARSLKKDPSYRDIPILAATGLAMPGDQERCLEAGCDDYIPKPFTHRDLQERLTRLLSTSNLPA